MNLSLKFMQIKFKRVLKYCLINKIARIDIKFKMSVTSSQIKNLMGLVEKSTESRPNVMDIVDDPSPSKGN